MCVWGACVVPQRAPPLTEHSKASKASAGECGGVGGRADGRDGVARDAALKTEKLHSDAENNNDKNTHNGQNTTSGSRNQHQHTMLPGIDPRMPRCRYPEIPIPLN